MSLDSSLAGQNKSQCLRFPRILLDVCLQYLPSSMKILLCSQIFLLGFFPVQKTSKPWFSFNKFGPSLQHRERWVLELETVQWLSISGSFLHWQPILEDEHAPFHLIQSAFYSKSCPPGTAKLGG